MRSPAMVCDHLAGSRNDPDKRDASTSDCSTLYRAIVAQSLVSIILIIKVAIKASRRFPPPCGIYQYFQYTSSISPRTSCSLRMQRKINFTPQTRRKYLRSPAMVFDHLAGNLSASVRKVLDNYILPNSLSLLTPINIEIFLYCRYQELLCRKVIL